MNISYARDWIRNFYGRIHFMRRFMLLTIDGCYSLRQTYLSKEEVRKEEVDERYKDLKLWADIEVKIEEWIKELEVSQVKR
jgi:hypothetical protein